MERKFLEDLGLGKTIIDSIMSEHGKSLTTYQSYKGAAESAARDRDAYKAQLDDVSAKLKAFDGVDIEALRGELDTLKTDMAAKEASYQSQLADRDFQALLTAGIAAANGKNPKAVAALLDLDALKTSKNQKEDIATAVKALAESDAYLFGGADKPATPAKVVMSSGGAHAEDGATTPANTNAQMNALITGRLRGE